MAATVTVRVIRTWEVDVPAEFGDTDASLKAKVSEQHLDETPPDAETRIVMPLPGREHGYATVAEAHAAEAIAENL